MRPSGSRLFPSVHGERDGRDQNKTLHHLPDGLRQAEEVQKCEYSGEGERAAEGGRYGAAPSEKLRAAEDGGCDRLKLVAGADIGRDAREAAEQDAGHDRRHH